MISKALLCDVHLLCLHRERRNLTESSLCIEISEFINIWLAVHLWSPFFSFPLRGAATWSHELPGIKINKSELITVFLNAREGRNKRIFIALNDFSHSLETFLNSINWLMDVRCQENNHFTFLVLINIDVKLNSHTLRYPSPASRHQRSTNIISDDWFIQLSRSYFQVLVDW